MNVKAGGGGRFTACVAAQPHNTSSNVIRKYKCLILHAVQLYGRSGWFPKVYLLMHYPVEFFNVPQMCM